MSEQTVTPDLRQWIVDQARAGHSPETVLDAMKASGWEVSVALAALDEVLRGAVQDQEQLAVPLKVPTPRLPEGAVRVMVLDREMTVVMNLRHPQVVVLADFLSQEECVEMIQLADPRLARSQTVDTATGDSEVNVARTSEGMFFSRGENDLCRRIEARIEALLNWPVDHGEGLQVLRYAPGAEYKPHYDYFDPQKPGSAPILKRGGQRVGTLIMYLNTPERGGATVFPDAGLDVSAVAGHAVFFSYPLAHPASKTLHGGGEVMAGEKWVATKWLRESRFE